MWTDVIVISPYLFRATLIQVPTDDLYDLHWNIEKGGNLRTLDPHVKMGSFWLAQTIFESAETLDAMALSLGAELVEASDLVKWHFVLNGIILPVGFQTLTGTILGIVDLAKG